MKVCRKCPPEKGPQPIDNFYVNKRMADGHFNECKECVKARVKKRYREVLPERHAYEAARNATPKRKADLQANMRKHRARNPLKYKARMAVNNAIRDGRLVRGPCRHCGTTKRIQAHHDDYSKPLDVKWECFKCHREHEHGQEVTAPDDGRGLRQEPSDPLLTTGSPRQPQAA